MTGTKLTSGDKKAVLEFVNRSKRTGKSNVFVPSHIAGSSKVDKTTTDERTTAVKNIVDLVQKSQLIEIIPNYDKTTKPNIDNYLRFYVPIKINNDLYTVRIVAENKTKENLFNILNGKVYDLIIDKKCSLTAHSRIKIQAA